MLNGLSTAEAVSADGRTSAASRDVVVKTSLSITARPEPQTAPILGSRCHTASDMIAPGAY